MTTPRSKEDVIELLAQHLASITDHTIEESRDVATAVVNGELYPAGEADGEDTAG